MPLFIKFIFVLIFVLLILSGTIYWAWRPVFQSLKTEGVLLFSKDFQDTQDQATHDLIITTYNIGYGFGQKNNQGSVLSKSEVENNLDEIADTLKKIHPDIVFLQEVDFDAHRTHHINQLQWLAHKLNLPFGAYVITWNHNYVAWPFWPVKKHFGQTVSGQAVLSRFPITQQQTLTFEKPKSNAFWYNWFYLDRVLQKITLLINQKKYNLLHVHLEAFDQTERLSQWQITKTHIDKNTLLVAGDFNQDSETLKKLLPEINMKNTANDSLLTFPSHNPNEKLDHIFFAAPLELINTKTTPSLASDHLPLTAQFTLK